VVEAEAIAPLIVAASVNMVFARLGSEDVLLRNRDFHFVLRGEVEELYGGGCMENGEVCTMHALSKMQTAKVT